ncbi:hypothetical protein HGRIS_000108 [Hohenbuehelia grisea]|uniref:Uncharacterized protein n=1 Tax=Hohenbuehelia grisea TaxID=104357 RepID=A0ABR3JQ85_9AGAR
MDTFSWSDTIYAAFAPCLACLQRSQRPTDSDEPQDVQHNHFVRAMRSDELEGLLAESGDTDNEAETLSLHSNPGQSRRKKRKSKQHKSITLFGWHLFGRPPIQLPDDDDDGVLHPGRRRGARAERLGRSSTTSSSTLDSDALMLSPAAIESISPSQIEQRARAAEEEERAKEERRARRRQKREMKRVAAALAAGEGEFEGFQGSGGDYPQIPSPFQSRAPTSPSDFSESTEGYGPFMGGMGRLPKVELEDEEDDEAADLDGGAYAHRARSGNSSGGSGSRSRTSASRSQSDTSHRSARRDPHFISQPPAPHPAPHPHLPHRQEPLVLNLTPATSGASDRKRSKKSRSSGKSKSSATSASISSVRTPSIKSPLSPAFAPSPSPQKARFQSAALPDFGIEDEDSVARPQFPSAGLSGSRQPPNRKDMAAFLANSGNL